MDDVELMDAQIARPKRKRPLVLPNNFVVDGGLPPLSDSR